LIIFIARDFRERNYFLEIKKIKKNSF